jgi:hypothetical protein
MNATTPAQLQAARVRVANPKLGIAFSCRIGAKSSRS